MSNALNVSSVEAHKILFEALLGRALNEDETEKSKERFSKEDIDLNATINAIIDSPEFFLRIREHYFYKLIPESSVVIGFGPMGHELYLDLRQFHMGFSAAMGHFEVPEARFVQKFLKPRMNVIDIGGNIGFFTTMFSALVGPAGHVTAFEPVTQTFLRLQAAIHRNNLDHNVNLYKAAASDTAGFAEISYPHNCINMGGVSIAQEGQSAHEIKERIRTVRLDDELLGQPVHFIKIDVEGAELLAIKGADGLIRKYKPTIMMEFNAIQLAQVSNTTPELLLAHILTYGYTAKEIDHNGDLIEFRGAFTDPVMNLVFLPV